MKSPADRDARELPRRRRRRGLLLQGGGAKGAYAFGCLLTFREHNIDFDVVAGTSIGAINAACWSADALDQGERLWRSITLASLLPTWRAIGLILVGLTAAVAWSPWLALSVVAIPVSIVLVGLCFEHMSGRSMQYGSRVGGGIVLSSGIAAFGASHWLLDHPLVAALGFATVVMSVVAAPLSQPTIGRAVMEGGATILGIGLLLAATGVAIWNLLFHKHPWEHEMIAKLFWYGLVALIPGTGYLIWKRAALLDQSSLRRLIEPIAQQGLRIPTLVCSARSTIVVDPDLPLEVWAGNFTYYQIADRYGYVPHYTRIDTCSTSDAVAHLLASASLPLGLFRGVNLGSDSFVDGGIVANLPLEPILRSDVDELIVIELSPRNTARTGPEQYYRDLLEKQQQLLRRERRSTLLHKEWDHRPYDSKSTLATVIYRLVREAMARIDSESETVKWPKSVLTLAPNESLGGFLTGTLRFQQKYIRRLIEQGRSDAKLFLQKSETPLCGD